MNKPNKPAMTRPRPAKTADQAATVAAEDPTEVAESPSPGTRPSLGALSAEELNDLNSRLATALQREAEFDALWSAWSNNGDYVAATAAGLAAAACRGAVKEIHSAWFRMRQMAVAIEDIDRPLASTGAVDDLDESETNVQALDRLVAEFEDTDAETLASVQRTWRRLADWSLRERVKRIRRCSEWSNPTGILYNHPPSGCVALFRALLVSPPVYMEVRDDLAEIAGLRKEAITFRERIEAHEKKLREQAEGKRMQAPQRFTLSGLTHEESEQFHDLLDSICAGDVRTRHGNKDSERISTVRLIAEHFRGFLDLSRTAAAELFKVEPWSTGIAALARASLGYKVTSEDVRGALKNWPSD